MKKRITPAKNNLYAVAIFWSYTYNDFIVTSKSLKKWQRMP